MAYLMLLPEKAVYLEHGNAHCYKPLDNRMQVQARTPLASVIVSKANSNNHLGCPKVVASDLLRVCVACSSTFRQGLAADMPAFPLRIPNFISSHECLLHMEAYIGAAFARDWTPKRRPLCNSSSSQASRQGGSPSPTPRHCGPVTATAGALHPAACPPGCRGPSHAAGAALCQSCPRQPASCRHCSW